MDFYYPIGKRWIDMAASLAVLIVLLPLLLLIALLVFVTSKGPIIFISKRMGLRGKSFNLYKFRTMYVERSQEEKGFTPGDRSRITPIGRILRQSKIDELPQLINVFKGEMSLVGPRPEVYKFKSMYSGEYLSILNARPGITDYASIVYRNEESILAAKSDPEKYYMTYILPNKLILNKKYLENITFLNDMKILALTIFSLFCKPNK